MKPLYFGKIKMKYLSQAIIIISLGLYSHIGHASGQRTTLISIDAISKYKELKFGENAIAEPVLHYVGTYNKWHILMITKTKSIKTKLKSDPTRYKTGRPWSRVFTYKVSKNDLTIVNGWDVKNKLKKGAFKVRPSYCPRLKITDKNKTYYIRDLDKEKNTCLNMKRFR